MKFLRYLLFVIALIAPSIVHATTKVIAITSGTTFTVPSDFSSLISVECLGAGGGGSTIGAGGAGAGYALGNSTFSGIAIGDSITIQVGVAGGTVGSSISSTGTADTFFKDNTRGGANIYGQGGKTAAGSGTNPAGGDSSGDTVFLGGNGGQVGGSNGGGGGGAAGPKGAGLEGLAGNAGGNGGAGDGFSGGNGGSLGTNGGDGTEWTPTSWQPSGSGLAGSGGGGGAGTGSGAGSAGKYGAGGGGDSATPGTGSSGIIIFTYTASSAGITNHFLPLMGVGQ